MNVEFTKTYQYKILKLQVVTYSINHHEWLQEFFCPHFQIVDQSDCDYQIFFREDTADYEKLLEKQEQYSHNLINCFLLDNRVIIFPGFKINNNELIVSDDNFKVFYLIDKEHGKIQILTTKNNYRARIALMRVIRELTMNYYMVSQGIFIHGSAFEIDGKAMIIVGNKGAGKTTLMLYNLLNKRTKYLSNDRLFILEESNNYLVKGMPTIASILPSSLEMLPTFKSRLYASFFNVQYTKKEAKELGELPKIGKNSKIGITPAQLSEITETLPISQAKLGAIVFPKITHQKGDIKLTKLSENDAEAMFEIAIFGGYKFYDENNVFNLINNNEKIQMITLKDRWKQLTSKVNCYECELGADAYSSEKNIFDFIET